MAFAPAGVSLPAVIALLAVAPAAVVKPSSDPALKLPEDPTALAAKESDVDFKANDGVKLAATLALPPDGKAPFPAVLFIPGGVTEPFDRNADYHGIKLFRQIAQRLAAHGVASLRYDKRGVGTSQGALDNATVASLGDDARAALAYLAGRSEIDRKAIAVLGHGEGAIMLLAAVAGPGAAFAPAGVILLAASSARGDAAIEENWQNIVASWSQVGEKERAQAIAEQRKLIAAARSDAELGKLSPRAQAEARRPYFKSLIDFDPAPFVRRLRAPVLLVHGQKDRQVSADHSRRLKAMLGRAGNRKVALIMDPYVNHLFAACETGHVKEYGALGSKADPEVVERIADWAGKTLRRR